MAARSVHALDDEARWLSETEVAPSGPTARRHLSPVRLYDIEADADLGPALAAVDADLSAASAPDVGDTPAIEQDDLGFGDLPAATTDDLLAELRASRGVRPELPEGIDEEDLPPAAHPPASRSHEAFDAQVLPLPSSTPDEPAPPAEPADTPAAQSPTPGDQPSRSTGGSSSTPSGHRAGRRTARTAPGAASSEGQTPPPKRRASRSRRASVPSWDEIVFGAKPD